MRTRWTIGTAALFLVFGLALAAAQQGAEKHAGVWSGTWESGNASGGFEMTIEPGKDGALAGKVSVTGEPTYKATLKTLKIEGAKLSATYDFTPDPALEVTLSATIDGASAKGPWSLRDKANGSEVAAGTWSITKK